MYVKEYIKIPDLKDGYLYKIIARNASYGIWRSKTNGFTISRIKAGNFAFEEHHYDCEAWGTAQPIEEVEKSPFLTDNLVYDHPVTDGKKYFSFRNEGEVLEYLNKFEGDRAYQWPKRKGN